MDNFDCDNQLLRNYGGNAKNNLLKLLGESEGEPARVTDSHYIETCNLLPYVQKDKHKFSVFSLNIRSIGADGKFESLKSMLADLESKGVLFSAICLQETWLQGDPPDTSYFSLAGYNSVSLGTTCGRHGGLLIYIQDKYKFVTRDLYTPSKIWEGQFIDISGGGLEKTITLGNIYKPPRENNNNSNITAFLDLITPVIQSLSKGNNEAVLVGDMNIDLLKIGERDKYSEYLDLVINNGFLPQINLPTRFARKSASLLDHIFCKLTRNSSINSNRSGILISNISDHLPTFVFMDTAIKRNVAPRRVKVQSKDEQSILKFCDKISQSHIYDKLDHSELADPDVNYVVLENEIKSSMDECLPTKIKRFNRYKHKLSPWISSGIIDSIHFRDKLYKEFEMSINGSESYVILKQNLQVFNGILRKNIRLAKQKYYLDLFHKFKDDIKKTWDTIKLIMNKSANKKSIPTSLLINGEEITDQISIVEKFNNFFASIGPSLASKIDTSGKKVFSAYLHGQIEHRFIFTPVTTEHVNVVITKFEPKTSTGHDNLSMKLLKRIAPHITDPLRLIINQSLATGIFPANLKVAKVLPLFKKGDEKLLDNYRPISLLPVLSKVFEKVVYNQVYEYFTLHKLFYKSQYGFRKGHSTELACLELLDRVFEQLDEGKLPIAIFIDLSKAFDTLDHEILLTKLQYYGIQDIALKWFSSYLSNRSQYVNIEDISSDKVHVSTGVPQGSILGPLLFIIYMNDIQNASLLFEAILYADDTNLISPLSVFRTQSADISLTSENLNKELSLIFDWFSVNKLSLNPKKTCFMIFHFPQKKLLANEIPSLKINNVPITRVNEFNFLGLHITDRLQWNSHINKVANKISKTLGVMYRIKRTVTSDILKLIYNTLIAPHLNYAILCWGFCTTRLTKLQKKAVRIINLSRYNAHTDPILKSLRLLKVSDMFRLNALKFYFKYCQNSLPEYFSNMFDMREQPHVYFTRANTHPLQLRRRPKRQRTEHSIRYLIPRLCQQLPNAITDKIYTHSIEGFSNYAKRYFVSCYNDDCTLSNCYVCSQEG